ncbi:MAG: 3'-5' exonuclease [Lentimicrobium sp.]|nr:3'-5' exonuclease [Lentimicrobium sp.]
MLEHVKTEKVLFLDIETVPQYPSYSDMPENFRKFWDLKAPKIRNEEEKKADIKPAELYSKAGIYAEFGKIICISIGFIYNNKLRIKSFADDDEAKLLSDFGLMLEKSFNKPEILLCAHNGKEFDFPYISRRMLINGIKLPTILDLAGKKPWESPFLDTMELWKFGDFKNYTSLALLSAIFNIPTPKDDIDGSQVGKVYWVDKDLARITIYCQKDVIAIAQLLLRYQGKPMIEEQNIIYT